MTRTAIATMLAVALAAPAFAQRTVDEEAWRAFAARLEPNALVKITLAEGRSLRGHVVRVDERALRVNPRTRVAVPLREIGYGEIVAIERQKEPRWNPAVKVLLGVGITVGALYGMAIAALASACD